LSWTIASSFWVTQRIPTYVPIFDAASEKDLGFVGLEEITPPASDDTLPEDVDASDSESGDSEAAKPPLVVFPVLGFRRPGEPWHHVAEAEAGDIGPYRRLAWSFAIKQSEEPKVPKVEVAIGTPEGLAVCHVEWVGQAKPPTAGVITQTVMQYGAWSIECEDAAGD
jgi:hypothetical protein